MTLNTFTEIEKLRVVEELIAAIKQRRLGELRDGTLQIGVLRAVAADIRARMPGEINKALVSLNARVQRVKDSGHTLAHGSAVGHGHHIHYDRAALRVLGEETIARWPEIRAAMIYAETSMREERL